MQKRIVLVEDDDVIRNNYQEILMDEGYHVIAFSNRLDTQDYFQTSRADIALVDIALNNEREGGFQLCTYLREKIPELPIIFLTSHGSEFDKISGLRSGADDHLTKDVNIGYLIIRIEALLTRFQNLSNNRPTPKIYSERLRLDHHQLLVYWDRCVLDLSLVQFWIFRELVSQPGHVKTYQQLMKAAKICVEDNTISAHIKAIRNCFKTVDAAFNCIRNERGIGYRWVET